MSEKKTMINVGVTITGPGTCFGPVIAAVIAGLVDANVDQDNLAVIDEYPERRPPSNDPDLDLTGYRIVVQAEHCPWGG